MLVCMKHCRDYEKITGPPVPRMPLVVEAEAINARVVTLRSALWSGVACYYSFTYLRDLNQWPSF